MNTGWWVTEGLAVNPAWVISWCAWFVISVVLHELAHGWAALWEGDSTPRELGHMTWNPIVHMGWVSVIMFALVGIGWGAMPVNPSRFRHTWGDALVSVAGPVMNLALAGVSILFAGVWLAVGDATGDRLFQNVSVFFQVGAMLNIVLACLNLLPIPPLDGSRILATYSWQYRELISHPNAPLVGMLLVGLLVFRVVDPFGFADGLVVGAINAVGAVLGADYELGPG
ncbi:MAG: site-2 protease family protein [Planctomycetota bacterium]